MKGVEQIEGAGKICSLLEDNDGNNSYCQIIKSKLLYGHN